MTASPYVAGLGRSPAGELSRLFDEKTANPELPGYWLPYISWCHGYWSAYNQLRVNEFQARYGVFGTDEELSNNFHDWWAYDICKVNQHLPLFQVARELPLYRKRQNLDVPPPEGVERCPYWGAGKGLSAGAEWVKCFNEAAAQPLPHSIMVEWMRGFVTMFNVEYFETLPTLIKAECGFFGSAGDFAAGRMERYVYDWCVGQPQGQVYGAVLDYLRARLAEEKAAN